MSAVKVLIVSRSTSLHPIAGGMEQVVDYTARALRGAGMCVGLMTSVGGERPGWVSPDAPYLTIPTRRPGRYSARWWLRSRALAVGGDRWTPDCIVAIGDAGTSILLGRHREIPVMVQAHGTSVDEFMGALRQSTIDGLARAILNLCRVPSRVVALRRASLVVCVSPSIRHRLLRAPYGITPERLTYIPNAVPRDEFRFDAGARARIRAQLGLAASDPVVVYSGRVEREKGAHLLIDAAADPRLSAWHVVVVGTGAEVASLRRQAETRGLAERLHLVGSVPAGALPAWYSAADVLALPTTRREGMPMVIVEALANGLPVVTTELGAASFDERAGISVSTSDPSELARNIDAAREDRGIATLAERYTSQAFDTAYCIAVRGLADMRASKDSQ